VCVCAVTYFSAEFVGVQGRESHILGNCAPQKPKMDESGSALTIWPARG